MVVALASTEIRLWQEILGIGAVVIVAVMLLLGLLLRTVGSIADGVRQLGGVAQGVAANTGNIKIALAVVSSLDEFADEAGRQGQLFGVQAR